MTNLFKKTFSFFRVHLQVTRNGMKNWKHAWLIGTVTTRTDVAGTPVMRCNFWELRSLALKRWASLIRWRCASSTNFLSSKEFMFSRLWRILRWWAFRLILSFLLCFSLEQNNTYSIFSIMTYHLHVDIHVANVSHWITLQWCQESLPRLIDAAGIPWSDGRAIYLGTNDTWTYLRFPCLSGAFGLWIFRERCIQNQLMEFEAEEEEEEDESKGKSKRGRPKGRGAAAAKKDVSVLGRMRKIF